MSSRSLRLGVAVVCVAVLLVAPLTGIVAANDHGPYPDITDVDAPESVTVGESVTVEVSAKNYGEAAGKYSTISVSSPTLDEYDDDDQAKIVSNTFSEDGIIRAPGDRLWNSDGNRMTADHVLAEGGTAEADQWGTWEKRKLSVEFTPEESGTFVFYVRTTMTDSDGETVTDPGYGSETDQQGYTVKRYEVEVREKPDIDAAIRDTDVDSGDVERGDTVDGEVEVENTGNREHTYFVGYGVYDGFGGYYDNGGTTGTAVTLAPGESRWVDVSWTVEDDANAGMYDARFSVWKESDRNRLYTRLADEREDNAFRVREEPDIDAAIRNVDVDSGTYQYSDTVDGEVEVENTGNREHTFFVGYGVYDGSNRYYDNGGTTGTTVSLAPGESRWVDVSWTVEGGVDAGSYDARFSVWKESDRNRLYTRLADTRHSDAFEVRPIETVGFTVSKKSSIEGYEFSGEPIAGATVEIAGQTLTTDDDGKVSLDLPVDDYDYTVSAPGYDTSRGEVSMSPGTYHAVSVPLVRENTGVVEVNVIDTEGSPVGGNTYRLLVDGSQAEPTATGELLLESGTHTVTMEPTDFGEERGLRRIEKEVSVSEGKRTPVEFVADAANKPPMQDVSVDVVSVDGDTTGADGYRTGESIRNMTLSVTGPDGNPVTAETLKLSSEDGEYTLTHEGDGRYEFESERIFNQIFTYTKYHKFSLQYPDGSATASFEVPTVSDVTGLRAPIRGWVGWSSANVTVDGTEYVAVELLRHGESQNDLERITETAWIAFERDGTLVTDPTTRRKVALAGMIAERTGQMTTEDVTYLREEYPSKLERQLTIAEVGSGIVTTRDTAAELLGTVGAGVVTGGGSVAAQSTVKGAVKATSKKFAKDLVKNYLKQQIPGSELRDDPLAASEKAIKLKARAEIGDAASESREAGRILSRHVDGTPWNYSDAKAYWQSKNESVTDGVLYLEMRINMLPEGDAKTQLKDITLSVASGATGAPAGRLYSLIEGGQFGYISESIEETARLRAYMATESRSYGTYGASAAEQARSQYGQQVLYAPPGESVTSASISIVDGPTGEYASGQKVNTTVEVRNTGDTAGRFFVGYSTVTSVDGEEKYFDNHGTTGHFVSLVPGETVRTNVTWVAESDAPTDQSYDALVAVWPEFPSEGVQPYQRAEQADAFSLSEGATFETDSLEVTGSTHQVGEDRVFVVDVTNDGEIDGTTVVNLTVDGTVVDRKLLDVVAGGTESATFVHAFDQTGTYTVESGDEQLTLTVGNETESEPASLTDLRVGIGSIERCDVTCREVTYGIDNPTNTTFEDVSADVTITSGGEVVWEGEQSFGDIAPGTRWSTALVDLTEEQAYTVADNDYNITVTVTVTSAGESKTVSFDKQL